MVLSVNLTLPTDPEPGSETGSLKEPGRKHEQEHKHTALRGVKGYWLAGCSSQPIRAQDWLLGYSAVAEQKISLTYIHYTHSAAASGSEALRQPQQQL